MPLTIKVYSRPGATCPQCEATFRFLKTRNIAHEAIDIDTDAEALSLIRSMGYAQVPVIVTSDRHWSGYRPDLLEELAAAAT